MTMEASFTLSARAGFSALASQNQPFGGLLHASAQKTHQPTVKGFAPGDRGQNRGIDFFARLRVLVFPAQPDEL